MLAKGCSRAATKAGTGYDGVYLKTITAGGLLDRLRTWFPEREFFMRSQGQVRFITISSQMQIAAAGLAVARDRRLGRCRWRVMARRPVPRRSRAPARCSSAKPKSRRPKSRVANYRDDIDEVTDDLARRQDFIEEMVDRNRCLPTTRAGEDTVSDSSGEAAETVDEGQRRRCPKPPRLARIEARQLAFVESA